MNNLKKYKKGTITMEIQSLMPEKFINLLWKNGLSIKNIKKINITTMILEVKLSDYREIDRIAKGTGTKIKIIDRKGIAFFLLKIRSRTALLFGVVLFGVIIYYLSTFIWSIEINTENNISPYELRQQITSFGVRPGLNKKNIDVYDLEEKILRSNNEIMWIKARIEGVKLKIDIIERQSPPNITADHTPCDLIASKDGIVVRVYTTEGTAIVMPGDMIQKGTILVKGEQGKEENLYAVHAKGEVIAKTFYEEIREVPLYNVSKVRTGNNISNIYIKFKNKKIYLKNSLIPYSKYDKIENNSSFINKEIYYEIQEKATLVDTKKIIDEIYSNILKNLDKTVKIVEKIPEVKKENNKYLVKVLVVAEENIAYEKELE